MTARSRERGSHAGRPRGHVPFPSLGLGTQTGNAVSVTISGSNNVLNLTTTNSGPQTIQDNVLNN